VVIAGGRIVAEGTPESIGGRAEADVTIEFRLPPGVEVGELPVTAEARTDGSVSIATSTPTEVLHALTTWARERPDPFELEGLTVTRPSLEDVYLELTASETEDER
jgi:ABC-2 type transport system ATP-binding protein